MTALGRHPNVLIGLLLAAVVVLTSVALIGLGAPAVASPTAPPVAPAGFVDCARTPPNACAQAIALARAGNEARLARTTHIVVDDICAPEVLCDRMYAFDSMVVFVTVGADRTGWIAFHAFGRDALMPTDAEPWPDDIPVHIVDRIRAALAAA